MSIGPYLEKAKYENNVPEAYFQALPTGRRDKQARARSIQGRFEEGRVYIARDALYTPHLVLELMSFPFGQHDDQVDALSWVGLYLNEFYTQYAPRRAKKASWRDNLWKYVTSSSDFQHKSPMSA